MKQISKKKAKAKREIAKIKKALIDSGDKCFFSGRSGQYDAFHICPVGACPQHETNPRNIVLSLREYNSIWVDRGTSKQVLSIPNVHLGFARMYEVDELYFNRKLDMINDGVSEFEFEEFLDLVNFMINT